MKCKKFLALVMTAVLSVSMLTACGGGGGGTSMSIKDVNDCLETVESDIRVTTDSNLNNAVRKAADEMKASGSFSPAIANTKIRSYMKWSTIDIIKDIVGSIIQLNPFIDTSYGIGYAIEESRLERGVNVNELASLVGIRSEQINSIGTVTTPEQFSAAVVIAVDEAIQNIMPAWLEKIVTFDYNVSARRVTTEDGVSYWVFGGQARVYTF